MPSVIPRLIRTKQRKDNTFPIALRVIKERKARYIFIGHTIDARYWDEKFGRVKNSYPNSGRLNALISKKIAEAEATLLELELQSIELTPAQLKNVIKGTKRNSFFTKACQYIELLNQAGNFIRAIADESRIKRFKAFLIEDNIGDDIKFESINEALLKKFMGWLKVKHSNSERTVMNYMVMIRTIYNQAIRDGLVSQKFYPFGKFGLKVKFPDSLKIGLSEEELKKLEEIELPAGSYDDHARNVFLFSFYFAGVRVADVLRIKWSDIKDGRLYYTMGKNNKPGTVKITSKSQQILNKYRPLRRDEKDYVFPELRKADPADPRDVIRKIRNANYVLNEALKRVAAVAKINKTLSMHIARHTFGNISGDRISPIMLQKLYRHSDLKTTLGYQQNFIHKEADEALEAVVGV